jgi:mannose-6-phosphate isomerase-like protein (cupin superfamily)
MAGWTMKNLTETKDAAKEFGFSHIGEAHFAAKELEARDTGLAYHVLRPGMRQGFGHSHERAEELHVILSGSGTVRLDDEEIAVQALDAIRVAPAVKRKFEAGPEGLAYVVFGPHVEKDTDMDPEFWTD